MKKNIRAFIGVGSNIEPEANVAKAFSLLREHVTIVAVSTMYWTAPLRERDIPRFINGVWEISTDLDPEVLRIEILKKIEIDCGRAAGTESYGSRCMDLDLLLYGQKVQKEGRIRLPHPDIQERPFVALPLFELEPTLVMPDTGIALSETAKSMNAEGLVPAPELTNRLRKELTNEQGKG
jgi:2-amino-4-hydroxy-6-hydroxymethyldihydropteridine diphosphokinase